MVGVTTAGIAPGNMDPDGFNLGDFGTCDVSGSPGSSRTNGAVTGFDVSQTFATVEGLADEGWMRKETNKLHLTVGCLPSVWRLR